MLGLLQLPLPVGAVEDWGLCHQWPKPDLSYPGDSNENAPTILNADSSESQNNEIIKLVGNILAQRPGEKLYADEAIYNKTNNTIDASGNIRYETNALTTLSDSAHINTNTNNGQFLNNQYFVHERHARGASDKIEMLGSDLTILSKASYTTCNVSDNSWILRAGKVKLNHETGMGSATNARMSFKGVPFFYIPYIRFPISSERMTGILIPSYASSELGGNEFMLPIYLNLHPQVDATITPHNYTNRGLKWEEEFRYLIPVGQGTLSMEQLDDEVYNKERSAYHFTHTGAIAPNWGINILSQRVSDKDYFNDFGNSLSATSQTHLERQVTVSHSQGYHNFSALAQGYQTIDESIPEASRPYRRLPQLLYSATPEQSGLLQYKLDSELVRFQRQNRLSGSRLNLKPSISLPFERAAGFIKPTLSLQHTRYEIDENNTLSSDRLTRTVPVSSLDSGIVLERDTQIGDTAYLHTLEPRLFYLYVPYRDQSDIPIFDTGTIGFSSSQLFSDNRFSGADRVGDTEQASLSVTSRLLRSKEGTELAHITLGQIYYLNDRKVSLNGNVLDTETKSDIIIEGEVRPLQYLSLRGDILWDTDYDLVTQRDFRLQYMSDNQHIINIAYRENGNRTTSPNSITREIDSSIHWLVNHQWSIIGRRYHSISDDRTMEKMAGVEYNSCCWAFRAVRRAIFTEDSTATVAPFGRLRYSWYLQLELKGMTSVGEHIKELMEETIVGYSATH
jgi:LPS-assembly protein